MKTTQVSGTAMGTAAMRAIESGKPANERICYDPFARKFTDPMMYHLIKLFAGYGERRTHGALTFIVCRCRYFDDTLRQCVQAGITQLVILGAGLDSRAYQDGLLPPALKTFEVDHPATQAWKLKRLKRVFGRIPPQVTFVPVDFNVQTLDQLFPHGYNRSQRTLFLWEGVTPYLKAEAVQSTLAWIRGHTIPGSRILFDYQVRSTASHASTRKDNLYTVISRLSGERRGFGFEKGQVVPFLVERGFTHVLEVNAQDLQRLYCTGSNRARKVAENYAIVQAEVKAGSEGAGK